MSLLSKIISLFKFNDIKDSVPPGTKLAFSRKELISTDFRHGVEIFNNETIAMELVINLIIKHFGLKKSDATIAMLICHEHGSVVLPLESEENAKNIVTKINNEVREGGHALVCKIATAQHITPTNAKNQHS